MALNRSPMRRHTKLEDTHIRWPAEDRELVQRAAELDQRSISQWVRIVATKAAKEILAAHENGATENA